MFEHTPKQLVSLLELHAYPLGIWAVLDFLQSTSRELTAAIEQGGANFTLPDSNLVKNDEGVSIGNLKMILGPRINCAHDYATWLDMYHSRQRAGEAKTEFQLGDDGIVRAPVMAKKVIYHCDRIFEALKTDLALREFVYVPPRNADYLRNESPFGEKIPLAFPSAISDIQGVKRALGFDMPVAAVFHACRVLEVAIGSLYAFLEMDIPVKGAQKTWGAMIGAIEKQNELRYGMASHQGWKDSPQDAFIKKTAENLRTVMIAWRNPTMHVEKDYTVSAAETICSTIRLAMDEITKHLDENGTFTP